jgi:hypothetical protein
MTFESTGSEAARGGFRNEGALEDAINGRTALGIQLLDAMAVDASSSVRASQVASRLSASSLGALLGISAISQEVLRASTQHQKADLLVNVAGDRRVTASLKKANAGSDFNQVDRRPVDVYQRFWEFSDEVALSLKLFTGDLSPSEFAKHSQGLRLSEDHHRIAFPDLSAAQQAAVLDFFKANKHKIVSDLVRGKGPLAADFMIVTQQDGPITRIHISRMSDVVDYLCQPPVSVGPRTTFCVGHLTAQRKGGTPDPTSLQFKVKPSILLNVKGVTIVS